MARHEGGHSHTDGQGTFLPFCSSWLKYPFSVSLTPCLGAYWGGDLLCWDTAGSGSAETALPPEALRHMGLALL